MRIIEDAQISKHPFSIPDETDVKKLEEIRRSIAVRVEQQEMVNKAKDTSHFHCLVIDSYNSMQLIERTAITLDPRKPDFFTSFCILQGRWRERLHLTEELLSGKNVVAKDRNILQQIADKIIALKARMRSYKK